MRFFGGGKERLGTPSNEEEKPKEQKKSGFFSSLNKLGEQAFIESTTKPRLLVCPQGIITYGLYKEEGVKTNEAAMLNYVFSSKEIENKINEILSINADALSDKNVQRSLGINVLNFQKSK